MRLFLLALLSSVAMVGCDPSHVKYFHGYPNPIEFPADSTAIYWGRAVDYAERTLSITYRSDSALQGVHRDSLVGSLTLTLRRLGSTSQIEAGSTGSYGYHEGAALYYIQHLRTPADWRRENPD